MAKKKQKNKIVDTKLNSLIQQRKASQKQIDHIQSQITSLQKQHELEMGNRSAVSEIENSYKKNKMTHLLNLNKTYTVLKNSIRLTSVKTIENNLTNLRATLPKAKEKIIQIKKEISNIKSELKTQENLSKTPKLLNEKTTIQKISLHPQFSSLYSGTFISGTKTFDAEWENVGFADGYITIKYNGHWYCKEIAQSKKYLNEIKHFYKFHNVPKLKIIISGSVIKTIENQEVLFYHIDFLHIAASNFGFITLSPFLLENWKKYTKQHYKKNLSFLFHTYTLKKLCEYCDSNLPIIPVGETVINSIGSKTIHNSFLFPIKTKVGYFIVWESIEEAKASYIFILKSFSDKDVQILFEYIAGDTPNKRQNLINSKSLQVKLNMKCRVLHKDISTWDNEIRLLCW